MNSHSELKRAAGNSHLLWFVTSTPPVRHQGTNNLPLLCTAKTLALLTGCLSSPISPTMRRPPNYIHKHTQSLSRSDYFSVTLTPSLSLTLSVSYHHHPHHLFPVLRFYVSFSCLSFLVIFSFIFQS